MATGGVARGGGNGAIDLEEAHKAYRFSSIVQGGSCTCQPFRRAGNCEHAILAGHLGRGGDVLAPADPRSNRGKESNLPDLGIRNLMDSNRRWVNRRNKKKMLSKRRDRLITCSR